MSSSVMGVEAWKRLWCQALGTPSGPAPRCTRCRSRQPVLPLANLQICLLPQKPVCCPVLRSVVSVKETHAIAEAQQEKNAKLREAFGISEYFVEGSSLDPQRHVKEAAARAAATPAQPKYQLVRTPSPTPTPDTTHSPHKRRKRKAHDRSSSPEKKKEKKKRSKKHKKDSSAIFGNN